MRTRIQVLVIAAALLGTVTMPARAQEPSVDSRWLAYLGCWDQVGLAKAGICVVPAGWSSVDIVKLVKGEVVSRDRIAVTGERVPSTNGDCTGWERAEWSATGDRVYLQSEETCPGEVRRSGTGVIAMTPNGQWTYVQGGTMGGREPGVSVQRYRETVSDLALPDDVAAALHRNVSGTRQARAAASAPLAIADVIEVFSHLDAAVLEAWLVERGQKFALDAKGLVQLADGGVPSRVIDLMVALSYPNAFAINTAAHEGERLQTRNTRRDGRDYGYDASDASCYRYYTINPYDPYYYDPMYPYSLADSYGAYDCYRVRSGYAYAYPYGYYPGGYPVTIIYTGSGGNTSRPHGRVVNGQGYKEGPSTGDANPRSGTPSTWGTSSGSTSGSTGTMTTTTSTSSSSGEQRTAKPRP